MNIDTIEICFFTRSLTNNVNIIYKKNLITIYLSWINNYFN